MTQVPGISAADRTRTGPRAFPPAEAPMRTRTQSWGGPWMRVLAVIASVVLLAGPLALHAESAVSAATAYGLLATVSTLPGLAVLLWHWLRQPRQQG